MKEDNSKPYVFPEECPARDRKIDKAVIVDVVENEIYPQKANKHEYELDIKKNMQ